MKFAVIDLETTGLNEQDEIIQIGLVLIDEQQIVERYTTLVKPGIRIPPFIVSLTGITDELVTEAPTIGEVLVKLVPMLADRILIAHHAAFDLSMLQNTLEANGYHSFSGQVIDTIDILRIVFPGLPSFQLNAVCQSLGISNERPHQADSDAEATAQVWIQCLQRLESLPFMTHQRLSQLFDPLESDLGWFIQQMRLRKEVRTAIDEDIYRYFRQFTIQVGDWGQEEDVREAADEVKLMLSFADFYEEVKGALQEKFSTYEPRTAQEMMIEEVEKSLQDSMHLLIEAGTGTGKSLGYLIPALYYGIREQKKVVISTHTINLQEQLRSRDLPLLKDIFPVPFKAAIMKGRGHYLCLRKFEEKMNYKDFQNPEEDRMTAAQMLVWLGETEHGDDEEINFGSRGTDFWRTVESDTDSCLNRHCPWFKKCFYHRAKHAANQADVVITNHSMLFTDTKADNRLLPAYEHLVIDEAHHFEATASKHLGIDIHYSAMLRNLLWLYKDSKSGLLPMLRNELQKVEGNSRLEGWLSKIDTLVPKLILAKEGWDELIELQYESLNKQEQGQEDGGQYVQRLIPDSLPHIWPQVLVSWENVNLHLKEIEKVLKELLVVLKDEQDQLANQSITTDLNGAVNDFVQTREDLQFFMNLSDDKYVYWLEANSRFASKSIRMICVPIDVSAKLREYFFEPKESIILTSATLSVNKTFDYIREQLGLNVKSMEPEVKSVQLPSPFQYRNQALVCVPRDFPSIRGQGGDELFRRHLVDSLKEVAIQTKGRMLVLFTSYRMLKQVYEELRQPLEEEGIQLLGQGQSGANRSKLTQSFQENPSSVLLGTSSFWEGVDIPGEALSCLAIVRLPFQPPSHPLVEAKSELIKQSNQNPFMKLSVPQAVIRFKQGFGRLVRSTSDRGVVIIYDTRVIDTTYGKHFLYSLPGPKMEHMRTSQLVPRIKEWMYSKEGQQA